MQNEASAVPLRIESYIDNPSAKPDTKPPPKTSPAPVGSTTFDMG